MSEAWSREEVEAAVADYLEMLWMERSGVPYNKAEHNCKLQQMLSRRSKGSIERKHQNISAVLIEFGYPYIDGYKPLGNYQELLREVVGERLTGADRLHYALEQAVERPSFEFPKPTDILSALVPPPAREKEAAVFREERFPRKAGHSFLGIG